MLDEAEDQISDMEDKVEIHPSRTAKRKQKLREKKSLNILDNMKCNNISVMGIPEEESEKGIEYVFEGLMCEDFLTW